MPMILNEEQTMLKDTAKDFCTNNTPIAQLRKLRDDDVSAGFDQGSWKQMVELGWSGIPWPESCGGLDFGYKGLGVVTEETGRTLTASPLFATVWLGGTLVNLGGNDEQKNDILGAVSAGETLLAVALDEGPHHRPYEISTSATRDGDQYVITGRKVFVLDGNVADQLIVVARSSGSAGDREGLTIALVDPTAAGVTVTRTRMADSRNAAIIEFDNVHTAVTNRLGTEGHGADLLDPALDIARIGISAEMLGSTQECFERTVEYLKERTQFGVPIGSFQALKHRAADMFCEIELSRSVVLEALTALDEGRDRTEVAKLASLAKCKVGETYHVVSREGIQMHGGIGMTDEFDIGFFIKRAAASEQTLGGVEFHRSRYADLEGF